MALLSRRLRLPGLYPLKVAVCKDPRVGLTPPGPFDHDGHMAVGHQIVRQVESNVHTLVAHDLHATPGMPGHRADENHLIEVHAGMNLWART